MRYPENYIEIKQYIDGLVNPLWLQMRLGCVTGSKIYDVVTKRKVGDKSKPLQAYIDCITDMVYEIENEVTAENYVSYWMKRGIENEPLARNAYEVDYGLEVDTRIGFITHPTIKMAGYSPDGLIGEDGLLEIKVPAPQTHWKYVIAGEAPEEYVPQMMWGLACTGRQWCDFFSHNPDVRKHQNLRVRLYRNEPLIASMEAEAVKFLAEVDQAVLEFRERMKNLPKAL